MRKLKQLRKYVRALVRHKWQGMGFKTGHDWCLHAIQLFFFFMI